MLPERLEPRQLLAADPIRVGVVYIETDYLESDLDVGGDSRGDRFILSFTGGAPDTQLTELRIRTDKDNDGISVGDSIFDTKLGGRGKSGAHDFKVVRVQAADNANVTVDALVDDGGQALVLRLSGFRSGDRLEFSIDVDEVLRNSADLDVFNSRLDVITSGQEFQDSILEATFEAPHYESSAADAVFLNDYGDPAASQGLNLPPDDGPAVDSRPNRSAAAVATTSQIPKPISISGQVWLDNNLDKIHDANEMNLPGVEIALWKWNGEADLYEDTGLRTVTDVQGNYTFSRSLGLSPGRYRIIESQPDGLYSVAAIPGTVDGVASGQAESMDSIGDIDVALGDTDAVRYDFAEAEPASLSGYVYRDDSNDGRRDAGEPGIEGVRVQLVPINTLAPQPAVTLRTAADGSYKFVGLVPGTYEVIQLDQPENLNDGLDRAGTINGRVVGIAENPGDAIRNILLTGADDGIEYNFGETAFGSLSGSVFLVAPSEECDGAYDAPGNQPLVDVRVELRDASGVMIATTKTDSAGNYSFAETPIGKYQIIEFTPSGLLDGDSHVGQIDGAKSGEAVSGGLIQEITMTAAGVGVEYNFCETSPATLSGYVYHDRSDDGARDEDEDGIPATTVSLVDSDGNVIVTTKTDARGRYEFVNIVPGIYRLVETQPTNYFDGKDSIGTVRGERVGRLGDESDSLVFIDLKQGDNGIEYNFGELVGASLSGRVHVDLDSDSQYDPGEPLLANVAIRLLDSSGNEIATTRTSNEGTYQFTNLRPGEYRVAEGLVDGYFEGNARVGSEGGTVIPPNQIRDIVLGSADVAIDYDFFERPPAEIRGVVFNDRDLDGLQDKDDAGIGNVIMVLYDEGDNRIASTRTDAMGQYRFSQLPAGTYTVRETQPAGWLQGGQSVGSHGGDASNPDMITTIPVGWGDQLTEYDFFEIEPGSISGVVYVDNNADSQLSPSEPPIAEVTIQLRDSSGKTIAETKTDTQGNYRFDELAPGVYQIFEQQPDGYFQGGQTVGTGGGEVLDRDLLGMTLKAGRDETQYNFGELPPGSISGVVYVDSNNDSQLGPSEPRIVGVTIQLRDSGGNSIAETKTDTQGNYRFDKLASGTYQVFEQQPDGYFQGGQTVGTGGGEVLDRDLLGMTLKAGSDETQYNFGELPPGSISGVVYVDSNGDCNCASDERPLHGVVVELRDDDGKQISLTTTDAEGRYRFGNLPPGRYHILEEQPEGYFQGSQKVGSGGGEVVDIDHLALNLLAGNDVVDYDFCEREPSSIAGSVWQETDLDKTFNSGDLPIPDVLIELLNENDAVLEQTRTDARGDYLFSNLAPGVYSIREIQPTGFFQGGQIVGSVGGQIAADDLLIGIVLTSGTDAIDYNFPEVPPATISGYVFQDGVAISLSKPPRPESLRDYRDGVFSEDDTLIGNVTLQLRNVLGQPFTSDRALPGFYADGDIRVTTDENGYYEFTGLRPGTYHVYQVQPENFIDGLETPGSTGGLAVNKADMVEDADRIVIQTLALSEATDPKDDAILNIALSAGGVSRNNNFSEITISEPQIPRLIETTKEDLQVLAPIETFESADRVVSFGEFESIRPPMLADDEWAVSWHLSIINGGFPRGSEPNDGLFRAVSTQAMQVNWTEGEHTTGRWIIVNSEGRLMEVSDRMTMGDDDALALTGDFDGNGTDESVLFVGGNWFVDLNGNGRWDKGDLWIKLGTELDKPVVGDWDGDGKDDIAIFGRSWQRDQQRIKRDPGLPDPENTRRRQLSAEDLMRHVEDRGEDRERFLRRGNQGSLRADAVDHVFQFGELVDTPLAGDWNGDGIDQIAVFRGGHWLLDTDGDGRWTQQDARAEFGRPGDEPIVGDFNGDGIDEIGVVRGEMWIIDTDGDRKITGNDTHIRIPRTRENSQPVVGDWDGDGKDELGYYDDAA
ncbi:SdrD B-like domain-containing protein [Novipirellula artificiosorum]|uniref:Serine-aspartate repeat-containing protein D n=1 Tax=Novipirellula artificiosorum TaxID=2528016 RepID=A0A5C6DRF2_9BACT|nr:Serine-aspartate repeat-containing protein D precursor [Novipirellula artificiosorum]